jgi:hypothetical protein
MSLIACSECNKKISDKAESCPNCGNPINIKANIFEDEINISEKQRIDNELRDSKNGLLAITKKTGVWGQIFIGTALIIMFLFLIRQDLYTPKYVTTIAGLFFYYPGFYIYENTTKKMKIAIYTFYAIVIAGMVIPRIIA